MIIEKPKVITGIIDVICFASQGKPAIKIYSNFNHDFEEDTLDDFIAGLAKTGDYAMVRVRCYTNFD